MKHGILFLLLWLMPLTFLVESDGLEPRSDAALLLTQARQRIASDDPVGLRSLGETDKTIDWYRWLRGSDRLSNWKADIFPAPRGWGKSADETWLVFHKFQLVEELCDRVHPIVSKENGPKLGSEIREDVPVPFRIEFHDIQVHLKPEEMLGIFSNTFTVKRVNSEDKALWMRLNAPYKVTRAALEGKPIPVVTFTGQEIPELPDTDFWVGRAGGVVWLQSKKPLPNELRMTLEYEGVIWQKPNDRIGSQYALLCSYWYPHIGRLPAKHRVQITVPKGWVAIGQGELQKEEERGEEYTATWQNDLPVCFFSLVAGPYQITAEARSKKNNRLIRMYQLTPDKARAEQVVEKTTRGMDFFEARFGDYPYSHYYLVETPDFGYSGLEAYSFTFLDPPIMMWACTHELAHTYWGGIVPNTYINSIWNESITQYCDSLLFDGNKDGSRQQGANTARASRTVPVGAANVPRDGVMAMAGYMRGGYVMEMLERELGVDLLMKTLKTFAQERRGQASEWSDYERVVNKVTGRSYRWFFRQWIDIAEFPELSIASVTQRKSSKGGYLVEVALKQSGTSFPFRLRLPIEVSNGDRKQTIVAVMSKATETLKLECDFQVKRVRVITDDGTTLLKKTASFEVK